MCGDLLRRCTRVATRVTLTHTRRCVPCCLPHPCRFTHGFLVTTLSGPPVVDAAQEAAALRVPVPLGHDRRPEEGTASAAEQAAQGGDAEAQDAARRRVAAVAEEQAAAVSAATRLLAAATALGAGAAGCGTRWTSQDGDAVRASLAEVAMAGSLVAVRLYGLRAGAASATLVIGIVPGQTIQVREGASRARVMRRAAILVWRARMRLEGLLLVWRPTSRHTLTQRTPLPPAPTHSRSCWRSSTASCC